ncbi:MAG: choice-of-anchor D domain-containing protein [Candidatus Cloacimonetes bacterium]|nr:choice-of-anchor D domain-containing protein [Candidatus Cloacimonadota bacterium]MCF7814146.1 choice-of-anchor D domain-containing protein [Candidatus Cloacimonadota bacterium]MCF7868755.1 choice-of-anchor D domain-containing protein [Candidatus Cloacimonadota bacterium]MCF7884145.1 choice-of-anchor D domain-containing protein [Candidatus Cloacimonadota bacterium]
MDAGGSLYIEAATIGSAGYTNFYPYLGLGNNSVSVAGYSLIESMHGVDNTFLSDLSMQYMYGSNSDYGIDELDAGSASPLMQSQDNKNRVVMYDAGDYRAITSSIFFSSLVDGNDTKNEVMEQYLTFMGGDPSANIWVENTTLDFDVQFAGYPSTEILTVYNTGIETLEITDITVTGDAFSYTGNTTFSVLGGESTNLEIVMNASVTGIYDGEMTIYSNDHDQPELVIDLSGTCVQPPVIGYSPGSFAVTMNQNETLEQTLTISNSGGYELEFTLSLQEIIREVDWLQLNINSGVVDPGTDNEVILTFDSAGLQEGAYEAELIIDHNDPAEDAVIIPINLIVEPLNANNIISNQRTILGSNYPNPFNPTTTIEFAVDSPGSVLTEIKIYNSKGQMIKTLVSDYLANGIHTATWNGKNEKGSEVPSGIYFYKMKSGDYQQTRKMILLK